MQNQGLGMMVMFEHQMDRYVKKENYCKPFFAIQQKRKEKHYKS